MSLTIILSSGPGTSATKTNSLSPLINRSIQGLYAPGSTFKMIVALAGLQKGVIDFKSTEFCEGKIEFGDKFYHCWKKQGHGKMNIVREIKERFFEVEYLFLLFDKSFICLLDKNHKIMKDSYLMVKKSP